MNSEIFSNFNPRECNSNLNSSDLRASKTIWNDIKLEPISWELNIENTLLSICVGVWVGENLATNFKYGSKDAQKNSTSFDTKLMGVARRGKKLRPKNRSKNGFYRGGNCVGWHEIKWIPLILYMKLISIKSWTLWAILRIKHPRI